MDKREPIQTTFNVNTAKIVGGWAARGNLTAPSGETIYASYPPGWELDDSVVDTRQFTSDANSAFEAAERAEETAQRRLAPLLGDQIVELRFIEQSGAIRPVGQNKDSSQLDTATS